MSTRPSNFYYGAKDFFMLSTRRFMMYEFKMMLIVRGGAMLAVIAFYEKRPDNTVYE